MDRDEHVCAVCGQPVATVVRRHKTLGAWVPVWGPGPCRNPECEAHAGDVGAVPVKGPGTTRAKEEPGTTPAEEGSGTTPAEEESGTTSAKES